MNRFSRAREYTPAKSPFDMNFIGQAMAYKQNKVDANRALIQETIDNIAGLTIDKPEAREYLYGRIEQLVNNVNAYRTSDLSNDGIARNISAYINTAMDETVINAYAGTMEGRKMEQYYDRLMMEDPERYNEANKAFALTPYYQWLQDGRAGSRLAPLQVSNYVNYTKEAEDVLKQMREARKNGMEWQYPDPDNDGYMITKKIDQMTPDEVEQAVYNSLSPGARKQMYIDGWYMANTQPEAFSEQGFGNYVSTINGGYDRKKSALMAEMAGAVGDGQRYNELRRSFDILDQRRQQFNNQARQIYSSGDRAQMGAFMVENNFLRGMAQTWSYDKSSMKMEEDPSYWKKKNYERSLKRDQIDAANKSADLKIKERELDLKEAELQLRAEKTAAEIEKMRREGDGRKNDGSGSGSPTPTVGVTFDATGQYEDRKAGDLIQARLNTANNKIKENANSLIKQLTPESREAISSWIEEAKASGNPDYAGLSNEEMLLAYFDANGGAANEYLANGTALDDYRRIKRAEIEMDQPMEAIEKFDQYQTDVFAMGPEAALEYAKEHGAKYVLDSGYLGEYSPEGISEIIKDGNKSFISNILMSVLAEKYVDRVFKYNTDVSLPGVEQTLSINPLNRLPNVSFTGSIDMKKASLPEMTGLLNKISSIVGESVNLEDVFAETENGWMVKPQTEGEPYTTTAIRAFFLEKSKKDPVKETLKDVGEYAIPGAGNIKLWNTITGKRNPVDEFIDRATDPKVFADIAMENIKERTPKAFQLIRDSKADKEEYQKWVNLYVGQAKAQGYVSGVGKFAESKISAPNVIAIQEEALEDGTIGYSMYMNGDESTKVMVNPRVLAENNIAIDDRNLIDAKSLSLKTKKVFVASDNNRQYAKTLSNLGVNGVSSRQEIMNTLLRKHMDIMRSPDSTSSTSYVPTRIGEEAVVMAHGVDAFEVGLEGYSAGDTPGVRVYLYDASKNASSRVPIYQYTIDGIQYANEALERLEICPQYYVALAYDHALAKYKAGLQYGTETGKDDWNNMFRVASKKAKTNG